MSKVDCPIEECDRTEIDKRGLTSHLMHAHDLESEECQELMEGSDGAESPETDGFGLMGAAFGALVGFAAGRQSTKGRQ